MDPGQKFLEYAGAFEQSFADDNWSRLERFFTKEAVYAVSGDRPLRCKQQRRSPPDRYRYRMACLRFSSSATAFWPPLPEIHPAGIAKQGPFVA